MYQYRFTWDASKAAINRNKHGVTFELAATVFLDPLAKTVYDPEHSGTEDRWVTIGRAENGDLLVAVHTHTEANKNTADVRIISAREATRTERRQYEE